MIGRTIGALVFIFSLALSAMVAGVFVWGCILWIVRH